MNMEKDDMAQVEGLNVRGTRYYLRVVIPADLQEAYGKARVNEALHTSDRRQAIEKATIRKGEWAAEFARKRAERNPVQLKSVSPALAAELAQRLRASILAADDATRTNPRLMADVTHKRQEMRRRKANGLYIPIWEPPEFTRDPLDGLTDEETAFLAEMNATEDEGAARALAGRRMAVVLPLVQAEARRMGLAFGADAPGAREALMEALKAYRIARQELTMRDRGEVIDTPEVPFPPVTNGATSSTPKARTLRDVFDRWTGSGDKPRSADAIAACERALRLHEAQFPGKALAAISREDGDTFRTWLRENSRTSKTARDRLTAIKSLLKYAHETLEWLDRQPWRSIDIEAKTTNKRRPWTMEELRSLFGTPLHQGYALPNAPHAGAEAAYWIPLLGLFTGARLGELCQLRPEDVREDDGVWALVLTDDGEHQSIKSAAGHRVVPIHSELVRLGFLDYVTGVKASGAGSLWPAMRQRPGKPSDFFGRWFRKLKSSAGLNEPMPDFHCFRHTVRPQMRRAGIPAETQDRITGHKTPGSIGTTTYDHWDIHDLQRGVEAIRYPGLDLPRVAPRGPA